MKILFLHGWHSVPGGVKPTYLAGHGHTVFNPALDNNDFDAAVYTAQAVFNQHQPDVIVGSSRGGAVAMNVASGITPLVLLCPAWKKWGAIKTLKPNSVILHSRQDDVIAFSDSEQLVADSHLPPETLMEVGGDHRLADESSLSVLLWACELLTSGQTLPRLEQEAHSPVTSQPTGKANSQTEVTYICDACGEEIVIPLDLSEGANQIYVEDCPVCCRANKIHLDVDHAGDARVWAEPEQDHD
jgi:hypothetical protein